MTIYIYTEPEMRVIDSYEAETNRECEKWAENNYPDEIYLTTYSPAFGCRDGLVG